MSVARPGLLAKSYSYFFLAYIFGISGWWRAFARLPGDLINMPIYMSEILLVSGLMVVFHLALASPDWKRFLLPEGFARSAIFPLLFVLTLLIPLRVLPDYFEYGFQALRDGVMLLYLLFIPLLFWLRDFISLRSVVLTMFSGQSAGILSYYVFNYLAGLPISFFYPLANESIAVLPVVAVLVLLKRWTRFDASVLCLAPTMLSILFWTKRSLLLGSAIVTGIILTRRFDLTKNLGKLAAACTASLVFCIGLIFLPQVAKPLAEDISVLMKKDRSPNSREISPVADLPVAPEATKEMITPDSDQGEIFDAIGADFTGPRLLHAEDMGGQNLMSWRLHLWKSAWSDIAEKPFWGWGFGPVIVKTLSDGTELSGEDFISGPHNAYLSVIYRLGWPLFVIFVAIPICFFYRGYLALINLGEIQLIAFGVICYSYFNASISLGFESPQTSIPAYTLIGLMMAPLWHIDRNREY